MEHTGSQKETFFWFFCTACFALMLPWMCLVLGCSGLFVKFLFGYCSANPQGYRCWVPSPMMFEVVLVCKANGSRKVCKVKNALQFAWISNDILRFVRKTHFHAHLDQLLVASFLRSKKRKRRRKKKLGTLQRWGPSCLHHCLSPLEAGKVFDGLRDGVKRSVKRCNNAVGQEKPHESSF